MTDPKQFTDVIYEVRDRAAWIIINRPKVYNAFRGQTLEELIQALHLAANDRQVASIVLTGAGDKAFCTGGDQSAHEGQYDGRGVVGLPIDELQGLIRDVPKPVIARVNGFAIGGGNVLATLCDLTIAADTAQFGQVGPKVGSVDAGWGTAFLARHVGDKKAREIWFINDRYTAEQAREMGLVNKVVPAARLDAAVKEWTDKLAQRSPTAIALAKRSFNADFGQYPGHQQLCSSCREAVLRHGGVEGRCRGVQREARTELPQVHFLTAAASHTSDCKPKRRIMASHKVIISCAVTGSIHTPSMSPHLPVTSAEIAESALGAAAAGAAIVHLHARNPVDGRPDQSPEAFEPFLRVIKQSSNVVVNLTTGGSPYMTVEERVRPAATWKPEVASLNMGSMNFGLFPMLKRYKSFKHDWEPQMLEGSHDLVFRNSFRDIRYALETLNSSGARYEFECYDTSHLYNLHYFWTEGLVKAPLFIQTCFGLLGGIGSHPDDVMHMKRTADRLFGNNYHWSVLGAGRTQMPVAAMAASMGGNVRVGLEDSLWIGAGRLAETNAEQVTQVRKIIEGLGLEIASPDEAREILQLKGGDKVAF